MHNSPTQVQINFSAWLDGPGPKERSWHQIICSRHFSSLICFAILTYDTFIRQKNKYFRNTSCSVYRISQQGMRHRHGQGVTINSYTRFMYSRRRYCTVLLLVSITPAGWGAWMNLWSYASCRDINSPIVLDTCYQYQLTQPFLWIKFNNVCYLSDRL